MQSFMAGPAVMIPAGPMEFVIEQWTFARRGRVEVVDIAESVILVVETGEFHLAANLDTQIQQDPGGIIRSLQRARLGEGGVAVAQSGATVIMSNQGEQDATLVVLALRPAPGATDS